MYIDIKNTLQYSICFCLLGIAFNVKFKKYFTCFIALQTITSLYCFVQVPCGDQVSKDPDKILFLDGYTRIQQLQQQFENPLSK